MKSEEDKKYKLSNIKKIKVKLDRYINKNTFSTQDKRELEGIFILGKF